MLHILPILCLLLFVGLVEYRLKKHLDNVDEYLDDVAKECALHRIEIAKLKEKYEDMRNE